MNLPKSAQQQVVAAFDFDGTLTYHDSLIPFLTSFAGPWKTFDSIVRQLPLLIGYPFGCVTRQTIKEGILKKIIAGMRVSQLQQKGIEFAKNELAPLIRPEGIKRLHWHQSQGHRCILISANLDIYLQPWASQEGFHDLICSKL